MVVLRLSLERCMVGKPALVMLKVRHVEVDLQLIPWPSFWYFEVEVHLLPMSMMLKDDAIILQVICSMDTSQFSAWPPPVQQFVIQGDRLQLKPTPWPCFYSFAAAGNLQKSLSSLLLVCYTACLVFDSQKRKKGEVQLDNLQHWAPLQAGVSNLSLALHSLAGQIELTPCSTWHEHQANRDMVFTVCNFYISILLPQFNTKVPASKIIKESKKICFVQLPCGLIAQIDFNSLFAEMGISFWRLRAASSMVTILSIFLYMTTPCVSMESYTDGLVILAFVSELGQLLGSAPLVQKQNQLLSPHALVLVNLVAVFGQQINEALLSAYEKVKMQGSVMSILRWVPALCPWPPPVLLHSTDAGAVLWPMQRSSFCCYGVANGLYRLLTWAAYSKKHMLTLCFKYLLVHHALVCWFCKSYEHPFLQEQD